MPGRGAEHRDQGGRLEAAQKRRVVSCVHDQPVGDEQQVEFAALGNAGDFGSDRQIEVADRRPLIPPPGGMVAGAEHEHAEVHLTGGGTHSLILPRSTGRGEHLFELNEIASSLRSSQ